jgi:hypothetical protein
VVAIRRVKRFSFFLFSSEAPTYLNSDRGEKLREDQWLISAILREINHLGRSGWSGSLKHLGRTKELGKEPTARGLVGSLGKVMPAAFYSGSPDSNRQSNLVTISGMTGRPDDRSTFTRAGRWLLPAWDFLPSHFSYTDSSPLHSRRTSRPDLAVDSRSEDADLEISRPFWRPSIEDRDLMPTTYFVA